MKVGDAVKVVELYGGSGRQEVYRTKIVRETATQWVDSGGGRWRKSDGKRVPRGYMDRVLEVIS